MGHDMYKIIITKRVYKENTKWRQRIQLSPKSFLKESYGYWHLKQKETWKEDRWDQIHERKRFKISKLIIEKLTSFCHVWYTSVMFCLFHSSKSNIFIPYAQPQARGSKFFDMSSFEKLRYLSKRWKLSPQVSTAPFTFPFRSRDQRPVRSFCTTMSSSKNSTLFSFGNISGK